MAFPSFALFARMMREAADAIQTGIYDLFTCERKSGPVE
jgi:hypothetical protein